MAQLSDVSKKEKSQPSMEEWLQNRVQELETQLNEMKQKYLYVYAELENVKKRAALDKIQILQFGWEPIAKELLEVIDNIERALVHASSEIQPSLADGLRLTLNQFKAVLEKNGVRPIEAIGKRFDPELHEAIGQANSNFPPDTVFQEESKGYLLHGRLLRPARVVVSLGEGQ